MKAWQKRLAVLPFVPDGVLAGSRQSWRPSQRLQRDFRRQQRSSIKA